VASRDGRGRPQGAAASTPGGTGRYGLPRSPSVLVPYARARTGGSQRRAWMMHAAPGPRRGVRPRARGRVPAAGLDDAVRVLRLFCASASARARTGGSQRRAWMLWRSLRYLRPWPVSAIGLGPLARGRATSPERHQKIKVRGQGGRACVHASPDLRVGKGVGKLPRPRMCPGLSCVQPPRKVESGNPTKDNTTAARRRPCLLSWRQEHRLSPAPHPPSRGPDPRGRTGPPRRGPSRGRRRLHPRNLSLSLSNLSTQRRFPVSRAY